MSLCRIEVITSLAKFSSLKSALSKAGVRGMTVMQVLGCGVEKGTREYEVDEKDLSAVHVAASLGEDIEQVFKTLILHGDRTGYFVCVIPGEHEVDLKLAAKVSGNKKCDLIPMKELLPLTGYIRGGCSPIGMKKAFPTYVHETCQIGRAHV